MKNPEKFNFISQKTEKERGIEKLEILIKEIVRRLKKEGVPVDEECRIDMSSFSDVYHPDVIEGNKKRIEEFERRWFSGMSKEEIKREKRARTGEQLELLVLTTFAKFLDSERFITVRSSAYDDVRNHIDTVILEKETGNIVCAFDEVGSVMGKRYEQKKEEILKRNVKKGGGRLKYGLGVKEGKLNLEPRHNIPVFYLALKKDHIDRWIKDLSSLIGEKSNFEQRLFDYFVSTLNSQINVLKLERNLNPELKKNLDYFEEALRDIKNPREKEPSIGKDQ